MTTKTQTTYRITSRIYQGGGVQSTHRTIGGARRAIARHDAAIRHLNRHGGSAYHDCRIEERDERGIWTPIQF